jgi:ElaB/YqjD/DUF883 family membrane-anchored ribosome-binding protein
MNATNQDPEKLEADIEATRAHMDDTLNAIEYKLTPGQLMNDGIDYLRHSGSGEFLSNLTTSARDNPMPIMLTAAGIGWLMMTNRSGRADGASAQQVREKAGAATGKAKETMQRGRERMSNARDETRYLGRRAADNARRASDRFGRMMHDQPLVIGALGIALGAALGAGVPRTETEDRFMGEARDQVVDKATEVGQQQAGRARATAQAAEEQAHREEPAPGP